MAKEKLQDLIGKEVQTSIGGFLRLEEAMGSDPAIYEAIAQNPLTPRERSAALKHAMNQLIGGQAVPAFSTVSFRMTVCLTIELALEWLDRLETTRVATSNLFKSMNEDIYIVSPIIVTGSNSLKNDRMPEGRMQHLVDVSRELRSEIGPITSIDNDESIYSSEVISEFRSATGRSLQDSIQWVWKGSFQSIIAFFYPPIEPKRFSAFNEYMTALQDFGRSWLPETWSHFEEICLKSQRFSAQEMDVVRRLLSGEQITEAESGLEREEWQKLMSALRPN